MKDIAIIYSFKTLKTGQVAKKIQSHLSKIAKVDLIDADTVSKDVFIQYKNLILGVPTWFDGELPNYWDEFIPELETIALTDKKIAIFGNGDQKGYSENFCDAVGIMADIIASLGAQLVGFTATDGYSFEKSKALKNGMFCGLLLDFENQAKSNEERIEKWCDSLMGIFA